MSAHDAQAGFGHAKHTGQELQQRGVGPPSVGRRRNADLQRSVAVAGHPVARCAGVQTDPYSAYG